MSQLTLPSLNQINCKMLGLLCHFQKERVGLCPLRMICPLVLPISEAEVVKVWKLTNCTDPWVEQILLLLPNVLRGAECQEQERHQSWRCTLWPLARKH